MERGMKFSVLRTAVLILFMMIELKKAYRIGEERKEIAYRKNEDLLNKAPCSGCNKDSNAIRTQYHLLRIKERIQEALGIASDEPAKNQTVPSGSFLSRVEDLMFSRTQDELLQQTTAERQILLGETEASNFKDKIESLLFKIPLDSRISDSSLVLAELWLPATLAQEKCDLKIKVGFKNRFFRLFTMPVSTKRLLQVKKPDGWIALSLSDEMKQYVKSRARGVLKIYGAKLILEVQFPKKNSPDRNSDNKPFMVIEFLKSTKTRQRRGVECNQGRKSVCCRERLTVRFADIGLSHRIIEPRQFEAYHCVGTCGAYSRSDTTRVEIVKYMMSSMRKRNEKTDHIKFCCTAAKTSPQKLLYYNNDKTKILTRMLDGLIVDECDCL